MEYPAALTSSNIEGANSAWTTDATDDQKVLIGDARRVQADGRCPFHIQTRAKVNRTVLPETADHLAGLRIKRVEIIANAGEEPLFAASFILPENEAALPSGCASGPFGLSVPFPEFLACGGVKSDNLAGG